MPYAQIAEFLRQNHQISVCRETIFKFVRVRSRGRRAYFFMREVAAKKCAPVQPVASPAPAAPNPQPVDSTKPDQHSPKPKFEFTYSERYNLKRLPPEEAAAIRKKLEAEGH